MTDEEVKKINEISCLYEFNFFNVLVKKHSRRLAKLVQ